MVDVILVDENDREVGAMEKMKAHETGRLHRAFSIFVLNSNGEMLLQKRAKSKYHSGGLWTNTCCSHPLLDESIEQAAHRRLKEEMGFDCELKEVFHFIYNAQVGELREHELDHVLVGTYGGEIVPNPEEADGYKWISLPGLKDDVEKQPETYTVWFKIAFKELLARYI